MAKGYLAGNCHPVTEMAAMLAIRLTSYSPTGATSYTPNLDHDEKQIIYCCWLGDVIEWVCRLNQNKAHETKTELNGRNVAI